MTTGTDETQPTSRAESENQATNEATAARAPKDDEDIGELDAAKEDEEFWTMVEEQENNQGKEQKGKRRGGGKKNDCGCAVPPRKPTTPTPPPASKEPPKDLPLLVVLTNYNVQKDYPAGTTLEEIRQALEMDYPAYSDKNTSWYFEEQREKNRVLCIPSVKSNKAG